MEAIYLACGAGGPQLMRNPLGSATHAMKAAPVVRLASLLPLLLAIEACGTGWRRPVEIAPGRLRPRQQVQVWRRGEPQRWHAVVIGQDSISGIPFSRPLECDTCRAALALTDVDSIRLGNTVAGFWKSVALGLGGLLAVCIAVCPRDLQ